MQQVCFALWPLVLVKAEPHINIHGWDDALVTLHVYETLESPLDTRDGLHKIVKRNHPGT